MSEPIDVTDDEIRDAAEKARFVNHLDLPLVRADEAASLVRAAINLINRVRVGDPVGTIRRTRRGIGVAVRARDGWDVTWIHFGDDHRRRFYPDGNDQAEAISERWLTVYSPEES